jgi:hypothetical protein
MLLDSLAVLSNIGHGGYRWQVLSSPPWSILADMAGFSAILKYDGATWRLVWQDFGSPPWFSINITVP